MNGAQAIVQFLKEKKIDTVFGYPGGAILELYDALSQSEIRHVLVRHEQGAVHAATGYAKVSGKIGVCIATSGPGATNLITGIADAYLDSVPLLLLTGQVDSAYIGRDAFQEADILGITIPITKHSYLVKKSDHFTNILEEAYRIAMTNRKGPVLIDISKNVFTSSVLPIVPTDIVLPRIRENDFPLSTQQNALFEAIQMSYRPLILAGGGIVADHASEKLCEFAKVSGIPIVTTLMGKGIHMETDVLSLGMAGVYGMAAANMAVAQCDLLLAVGTRFSDHTIGNFKRFSRSRMIVHADIDPAEISKNVTADIGVVCGASEFFDTLLLSRQVIAYAEKKEKEYKIWSDLLKSYNKKRTLKMKKEIISMREILRMIEESTAYPHNFVYVTDVGKQQVVAAQEMMPCFERGFVTSGGLGVMGFGLPGAIGASFAVSESVGQILLFCGDGGFQMTMEELVLVRQAKRPIKIFIFDNHALGMVKQLQKIAYHQRYFATELNDNPDFELIGKAYGIQTAKITCSDRPHLEEKLIEIIKSPLSMIIHCLSE